MMQPGNLTGPGGRVMLVGNPASDMTLPKAVYWKILRNQLTVFGTWNSSFTHSPENDWYYVLDRGLFMMKEKKEEYGKVMIG